MRTWLARTWLTAIVALTFVTGGARIASASCTDDDPDGSKVAAARLTAEQNCEANGLGCASAPSHGAYVSCIAHEIKTLSSGDTPSLPRSCKGAAKRCAAKSVCGKQARGFVTCCITNETTGTSTCKSKHSSDLCTAAGGTPSACGSCCDVCPASTGPTCPAG